MVDGRDVDGPADLRDSSTVVHHDRCFLRASSNRDSIIAGSTKKLVSCSCTSTTRRSRSSRRAASRKEPSVPMKGKWRRAASRRASPSSSTWRRGRYGGGSQMAAASRSIPLRDGDHDRRQLHRRPGQSARPRRRARAPVTADISNCLDDPPSFTGCAASKVSANWRDDRLEKHANSRTSRVCQTVHPQADPRR